MRKKIIYTAIIFIVCIGAIKCIDITQKYDISVFDYAKYSLPLTKAERRFLATKDIQYGIDINNEPFAFVSGDTNQNTGILVDYFNQLSVTLENNFQPTSYDSYNLAVKLKDGEMDAAVLNRTNTNADVFLFTQPFYTERCKILVQGDSSFQRISDVSNISIAVITGSTAHHVANKIFKNNSSVKLILTDDLDESFYLFGMSEVDALLGDEAKISYYLNQGIKDNRFKFLKGALYEEEVGVAVNKDNELLYSILNKGILEMKKTNQYNHIHSKWFGSFIPEVKDVSNYGMSANVVILILSIAFAFLVWNQTVSHRVAVKTSELHESREELRNILDSLVDGIIVTDSSGNIQVCNRVVLELLGISSEKAVGADVGTFQGLEPYLAHVNDQEPFKMGEHYYLTYRRRLDVLSGKYLMVIEDYTARYKYESLTRQEAKMIAVGELSAGLAHEIRNPLGLIKSYIYLLRKKASGAMEEHSMNVIDDSVDRINNLIENLLGFSRLSVEKSTEVDIKRLISSIVLLENKNLEKSNISMDIDFRVGDKKHFMVNEDVLKLTLVNLINNSIDALSDTDRENKQIRICVRIKDDRLYIDFSDNGCGIPKENMETIFNPFFTTKETGTGLGLYILNSEIRGVDGSISVESVEAAGTTFHVILPAEPVEQRKS